MGGSRSRPNAGTATTGGAGVWAQAEVGQTPVRLRRRERVLRVHAGLRAETTENLMEVWKSILDGWYEVSDQGNVRRARASKFYAKGRLGLQMKQQIPRG